MLKLYLVREFPYFTRNNSFLDTNPASTEFLLPLNFSFQWPVHPLEHQFSQ